MKSVRRFPFKSLLFVFCLLGALYLARALWLPLVARALVNDEGAGQADIAVVLAGDPHGHRILKAAELVKAGYVRNAIVSGPSGMYGVYENDLAIPFVVRHGYPLEWFVPLPNSATSTAEEAVVVIQELRRRNIHSFILVTSDYHTARAARIFRATCRSMGGGLEMRVTASPDEDFHVSDWWHNRLGQKTVFLEWCKTIATALGV